jgi:hypothetical protein
MKSIDARHFLYQAGTSILGLWQLGRFACPTRKGNASMLIEGWANWRLPAAGILVLGVAILAGSAEAGGDTADLPHACFANDSIVMGKRLAPRPAVIEARLNSAACRQQSALDGPSPKDAAAVQRELNRIDETLTSLLDDKAKSPTPSSAN